MLFSCSILHSAPVSAVIADAIQSANPIIMAENILLVSGRNIRDDAMLTAGIATSANTRIGFQLFQIGTAALLGYKYAQSSMSVGKIGYEAV